MKGISDLLESDVESSRDILDENSILSTSTDHSPHPASKHKATQSKKTKKRHCVTMPKPKSRVAKTSPASKQITTKKTTAAKRKVLEELVNGTSKDEHDTDTEIQETQAPKPRARPEAKAKPTKATTDQDEMEIDQTPAVARSSQAASRPAKAATKVTSKSRAPAKSSRPVAKTSMQEIEHGEASDSGEEDVQLVEQVKPHNGSRQPSRVRPKNAFRRRAGSASDTERGDPNLRRKLGDVTRRFENVDLKYRNLKEVGVNEANANMEKLRKQCEATTQASNELIASLKKEIAMQAPLAQDARKLKKQIQAHDFETAQLRKSNGELSAALTAVQNEVKSLQARLAAARSSSVAAEGNSRTPARDGKLASSSRTVVTNSSEVVQQAQMKEELYSDLTGLIVRSVKRSEDGDTYDCIQTGRNGTLHFKLFVDAEDARTSSFEQTDFLYQPLLDSNRDKDMIELMPDYLTEEITFSRQDAAKFYGRVLDTLVKRRTDE